jgi:hypothetical protein
MGAMTLLIRRFVLMFSLIALGPAGFANPAVDEEVLSPEEEISRAFDAAGFTVTVKDLEAEQTAEVRTAIANLLGKNPRIKQSLLGERRYVLLLNERGGLGRYTQTVSRAPEGDEASYVVATRLEMQMGPVALHMDEQAWLGSDASVLRVRLVEKQSRPQKGATAKIAETSKTRGELGWIFSKVDSDGRSWEATHKEAMSHWGEVSAVQTLLRMAKLTVPGTYELEAVVWADNRAALKAETFTITVGEEQAVPHHDTTVKAVLVQMKGAGENSSFLVSKKGEILSIIPKPDNPLRIVACRDEEECERLEAPPELEGPAAVVMVLFECLVGKRDREEMDQVIAWEQLAENASEDGQVVTVEEAKKALWASMKKSAVLDTDFLEALHVLLQADIEGEQAVVTISGVAGFTVRLVRLNESWKIVELPY